MQTFDRTYQDHLIELAEINLAERAQALKLETRAGSIVIPAGSPNSGILYCQ